MSHPGLPDSPRTSFGRCRGNGGTSRAGEDRATGEAGLRYEGGSLQVSSLFGSLRELPALPWGWRQWARRTQRIFLGAAFRVSPPKCFRSSLSNCSLLKWESLLAPSALASSQI